MKASFPAIQVQNLTVKYPNTPRPTIQNINFSIASKQIVALIGPNGSGKSTLVKAMLELIPYSGQVLYSGKPLNQLYHQVGYVPQRFGFDRTIPITVNEFLALSLSTCNHTSKEKSQMIKAVLHKLKITNLFQTKLNALSGGQLQKVLFARALVHEPKFLILDELEAGIDTSGEMTLFTLLEKLVKKEGITTIVISHELEIVRSYADQVICINGQLICQGKPKDVFNKDMFQKLYGSQIAFHHHAHSNHNQSELRNSISSNLSC